MILPGLIMTFSLQFRTNGKCGKSTNIAEAHMHSKERYDHSKTVSSMKAREAQACYEKSVALKAK